MLHLKHSCTKAKKLKLITKLQVGSTIATTISNILTDLQRQTKCVFGRSKPLKWHKSLEWVYSCIKGDMHIRIQGNVNYILIPLLKNIFIESVNIGNYLFDKNIKVICVILDSMSLFW